MKREPDFAIISRIEVGVREPGVDTPNLSGQVVYSLMITWGSAWVPERARAPPSPPPKLARNTGQSRRVGRRGWKGDHQTTSRIITIITSTKKTPPNPAKKTNRTGLPPVCD